MRTKSQYANPIVVNNLLDAPAVSRLKRVELSGGATGNTFDERWLQCLVFRYPETLPVHELETGFDELVPVALEVPTASGYIDNLYLTPQGDIVLAECKLWRNPESRRKVIAQIIDYAQSLARWSFSELDAAVGKSKDADGKTIRRSIVDTVSAATGDGDFDEARFIDTVQRNLRRGRMLLLIIGDGVREDVEGLADYLQMHAGFHFSLGLIETAIFELPDHGGFVVQPRVLARTLNIERAVVRIIDNQIVAEPVPAAASMRGAPSRASTTLSEDAYFEALSQAAPKVAEALRRFAEEAADEGVYLEPAKRSTVLKWEAPTGKVFNLGGIDLDGHLQSSSIGWIPSRNGMLPLAHAYLEDVAALASGTVRKTADPTQWYVKTHAGHLPDAEPLLRKSAQWLDVIRKYKAALLAASEATEAGGR